MEDSCREVGVAQGAVEHAAEVWVEWARLPGYVSASSGCGVVGQEGEELDYYI